MNSNTPNLFRYATKELDQDAVLAYILAWADPANKPSNPRLHRLGTAMLRDLLATKIGETAVPTVTSLDVDTQVDHIDLLARINIKNEDGLVLLIEDKLDTDEHTNQIERYIKKVEKRYLSRKIVPVYVKTRNASRQRLPSKEKCGRFLRPDLLKVLNQFPNTDDTIVDNFREHLQGWEDETNRYLQDPVSKWNENERAIEGFYIELERRMANGDKSYGPDWTLEHNRGGEVLCFTFAVNRFCGNQYAVSMYPQIENGTRLTVRFKRVRKGPKIPTLLMYKVLGQLQNLPPADDIKIDKPGRFGSGQSVKVAELTFGEEKSYLAQKDGEIVDMDATMQRLDRTREFISKVANQPELKEIVEGHLGESSP